MKRMLLISVMLMQFCLTQGARAQIDGTQPPYTPIIVAYSEGKLDPEIEREVIENLSGAMTQAGMSVLAKHIYGRNFPGATPNQQTGIVAILETLKSISDLLDSRAATLKTLINDKAPNTKWSYNFELIWKAQNQPMPKGTEIVSAAHLGQVVDLLKSSKSLGIDKEELFKPILGLAKNPIIDVSDDIKQLQNFYNLGPAFYEWIATDTQQMWLPLNINIMLQITGNKLSVETRLSMKPGTFFQPVNMQNGGIFVEWSNYQPQYFGADKQDVAKLIAQRELGLTINRETTANLTFGRLANKDIRSLVNCFKSCADFVNRVPTIRAKAQSTPGTSSHFVNYVEKSFGKNVNLYILLNNLRMVLPDNSLPYVDAVKSLTPLVIRWQDYFRAFHHININEFADPYPLQLYNSQVRGPVAQGLTAQLQGMLQTWGITTAPSQ